ncbi:hypothetical protein BOX15_Mlig006927g3, partial [Macrostomum lignano]
SIPGADATVGSCIALHINISADIAMRDQQSRCELDDGVAEQRKRRYLQCEHQSRRLQQPPLARPSHRSRHRPPVQRQPQPQESQGHQSNQQNSGSSARSQTPKPTPLCNMATTVSYPTGASSCEMIGWHVANMDAKLNALFDTMSEIYKDTAMLAGESEASAAASMQELVEPGMFTLLQRESTSWDPSVMNKKVSQLVLIGSWIYHRTQSVVNGCCEAGLP